MTDKCDFCPRIMSPTWRKRNFMHQSDVIFYFFLYNSANAVNNKFRRRRILHPTSQVDLQQVSSKVYISMRYQNSFFQTEESNKQYTKRILIVEHSESLGTLYKSILLQSEYTILTISSGQEALEMIPAFHPNLIITPNDLVDMTCERLRKEVSLQSNETYIPLLVLSTQKKMLFSRKCSAINLNETLFLPFRINDLRIKVEELLGGETISLSNFYYPSNQQSDYEDKSIREQSRL